MNAMGKRIGQYRKRDNITQDALAEKLGVSNQAVSKWESGQCFPDITLLPKLADIFSVSLDELFGRAAPERPKAGLPWPDDNTLHAALFVGHTLQEDNPDERLFRVCIEGKVWNVDSRFDVTCETVEGSVKAGGSVRCDAVGGSVQAGGNVQCDVVGGTVRAGGNFVCDSVGEDAFAGGDIHCDWIKGNASAGGSIACNRIGGQADAADGITESC